MYDSIPLVCFIYILKWYLITMFFFLVGYLQKTCPVLLDYVELYPLGLWNHTMPVKEWLLQWIHYVEFLERAPGYRMEEAAGWITSHSHSLHNVSIAIYFFFYFLHYLQKIIIFFLPAFSDIDKICKLSVSSRSVYSSGISFCVIGFLKHFQTISLKLLQNIFPWPQEDCYWETYMHVLNTDKMYEFMTLTLWPHLTYVKGLKSWVNTFSLCVTLGFLGNISLKSLWAFAMKQ